MSKRVFFLSFVLACALAAPAFAQHAGGLSVREANQSPQGVDRVLRFRVENTGTDAVVATGRVVVINVYGTGLPASLSIEEAVVPANGTAELSVLWHDAPIIGQIRATLILNEGQPTATVASYAFWLLPNLPLIGGAAAGLILLLLIVHFLMRPRPAKKASAKAAKTTAAKPSLQAAVEAPVKPAAAPKPALPTKPKPLSSTLAYRIEPGDTVMTLSSRFEVSWQDLVRANRLKPPYTLVPGKTVQIPRHALKQPKPPAQPRA